MNALLLALICHLSASTNVDPSKDSSPLLSVPGSDSGVVNSVPVPPDHSLKRDTCQPRGTCGTNTTHAASLPPKGKLDSTTTPSRPSGLLRTRPSAKSSPASRWIVAFPQFIMGGIGGIGGAALGATLGSQFDAQLQGFFMGEALGTATLVYAASGQDYPSSNFAFPLVGAGLGCLGGTLIGIQASSGEHSLGGELVTIWAWSLLGTSVGAVVMDRITAREASVEPWVPKPGMKGMRFSARF